MAMEVDLPLCRFLMLWETEERMKSYFNVVDFWDAASLYVGFNCVNCIQCVTVVPFCGVNKRFRHTQAAVCFREIIAAKGQGMALMVPCSASDSGASLVQGEWLCAVPSPAAFDTMTPSASLPPRACGSRKPHGTGIPRDEHSSSPPELAVLSVPASGLGPPGMSLSRMCLGTVSVGRAVPAGSPVRWHTPGCALGLCAPGSQLWLGVAS